MEQLKVTEIKSTFEETSLSLTWKPPNLGYNFHYSETFFNATRKSLNLAANFSYNVSLNSGMSNVVTVPSTRFEGLTPGTLYTVSVATSVVRDPGYGNTEVESSPDVSNSFYTSECKQCMIIVV